MHLGSDFRNGFQLSSGGHLCMGSGIQAVRDFQISSRQLYHCLHRCSLASGCAFLLLVCSAGSLPPGIQCMCAHQPPCGSALGAAPPVRVPACCGGPAQPPLVRPSPSPNCSRISPAATKQYQPCAHATAISCRVRRREAASAENDQGSRAHQRMSILLVCSVTLQSWLLLQVRAAEGGHYDSHAPGLPGVHAVLRPNSRVSAARHWLDRQLAGRHCWRCHGLCAADGPPAHWLPGG